MSAINNPVTLNLETLGELLIAAARRGLDVGKAGTEGDFTAEGIAGHVIIDAQNDGIL